MRQPRTARRLRAGLRALPVLAPCSQLTQLTCLSRAQIYGAIQSLSFNDLTGSALVEYSTIGEAVSANNALQGQAIAGQELKVAFETVGGPPQPPGRASASASAPGAPAVVSRPSLTCSTPLHSCLASRAASHPALRFAIPLRRRLQSHLMSRQPPISILCSIHKQMEACCCVCAGFHRALHQRALHLRQQSTSLSSIGFQTRSSRCRWAHPRMLPHQLASRHAWPLPHEDALQLSDLPLHRGIVLRRMSAPHRSSGLAYLAAPK